MRSSLQRMTAILFLTVLLVPGLLHAWTPTTLERTTVNGVASEPSFFSVVWNLLTNLWGNAVSGGSEFVKTDPVPPPTGPGSNPPNENGGGSDPDG
jgi:hypothetical protein